MGRAAWSESAPRSVRGRGRGGGPRRDDDGDQGEKRLDLFAVGADAVLGYGEMFDLAETLRIDPGTFLRGSRGCVGTSGKGQGDGDGDDQDKPAQERIEGFGSTELLSEGVGIGGHTTSPPASFSVK